MNNTNNEPVGPTNDIIDVYEAYGLPLDGSQMIRNEEGLYMSEEEIAGLYTHKPENITHWVDFLF